MQDILYLSGIQHHALRTNPPQNVRAESLRKQMDDPTARLVKNRFVFAI
jgi:hypothetical protein